MVGPALLLQCTHEVPTSVRSSLDVSAMAGILHLPVKSGTSPLMVDPPSAWPCVGPTVLCTLVPVEPVEISAWSKGVCHAAASVHVLHARGLTGAEQFVHT